MCGGTPLIEAPIGQKRVSVLVMCPHCKKLLLGRERKGVLILSGVSLAVPRMRSSPRVFTLISPATMEGVFLPHKTQTVIQYTSMRFIFTTNTFCTSLFNYN